MLPIQKLLNELIPNPTIPLLFSDPYTLLIATLLSAQCTDERVNKVTPLLFSKAATPLEMIRLSVEEIATLIRPCGLNKTKAKHIRALSVILLEKYEGQVPSSLVALEGLPGVGHKTASVVLLHAFSRPAFPVDRHIFRSAHRWHLSTGKTVRQVEEDLKKLFPKNEWGRLHLQIILAARQFCPARPHTVDDCPICSQLSVLK
jgi:endonuclease-3